MNYNTILNGHIHICDWSNYCDYNKRNGSSNDPHNRNSLINNWCEWTLNSISTTRKRSLGQGNILTPVSHGGGVSQHAMGGGVHPE